MSRIKYGNGEYHRIGYNNKTYRKIAFGTGPIHTLISYTATRVSDMGSGSFTHNTSSAGYTNASSTVKVSNSLKSSYYPYSMSSTSYNQNTYYSGSSTARYGTGDSQSAVGAATSSAYLYSISYPGGGITITYDITKKTTVENYVSSYSYTGATNAVNNNSGHTAYVSAYTRKCGAQVATYNISRSSSRSSQYTY